MQPGGRVADRARGRPARAIAGLRGSLPRPQPRAARTCRRGSPQRHPRRDAARAGPAADRRRSHPPAAGRRRAGCQRRDQADGRPGPALPGALPGTQPGTARAGAVGAGGPGSGRPGRADRLRLPRPGLPERAGGRAAPGRNAQHSGRDCPAARPARHAGVVAAAVGRRVRGGPRRRAVADRPRSGLARGGGLGHAGAAGRQRLAVALVCDLAAAASRGLRRSAPAVRRAPRLCLRRPDPPAAG